MDRAHGFRLRQRQEVVVALQIVRVVVEATPERVVLENTRCPFGETVMRSPALCRMTSSVFGGIAARNSDEGASVLLEERIAVGDPGCRVVVYLGEAPHAAAPYAHRYGSVPDGP